MTNSYTKYLLHTFHTGKAKLGKILNCLTICRNFSFIYIITAVDNLHSWFLRWEEPERGSDVAGI